MRALVQLDFVGTRPRVTWPGGLLLVLGVLACAGVTYAYHSASLRRSGLEFRIAAAVRAHAPAAPESPQDAHATVSAEQAAQDLATPWTLLLAELEQASKDSQGQVALLGVEPDHGKHAVRVSAEARTLELALRYVERLQASRSLEYPMLDKHEIRDTDSQHPVRFELTGQWKDST